MSIRKIYIIGESHTRSYAYRNNIVPIFIGSGRNVNLANLKKIKPKIIKILKNIEKDSIVCFLLGEPDCRHQLGYGWDVCYESTIPPLLERTLRFVPSKIDKEYLDDKINNYFEFLKEISCMNFTIGVISITGVYYPTIPAIRYCNNKLKELISTNKNILFLDIFDDVLHENLSRVKKEYADPNPVRDCIHINSKASDLLLDKLPEQLQIDTLNYKKLGKDLYSSRDVINSFKFNKEFGSYTI